MNNNKKIREQNFFQIKDSDSLLSPSRRKFLKSSAISLAGFLAGCSFASKFENSALKIFKTNKALGKSPNILLILADDQGMHLSCVNTPGISTPNMDALAKNGVLFLNAHSTCASCSPSRSSILTGMYPHSNGHWRNTITPVIEAPAKEFGRLSSKIDKVGIREDIPTLPEILNKHNYLTGITRKWHLSPHWKFPFKERIKCDHSARDTKEKCASFFNEADDKPFFLLLNLTNTHRPFKQQFFNEKFRVSPDNVYVPPELADTKLMREDLSDYYSNIQCQDENLGKAVEALRESGKLENTLIIFTSDHGWAYHRAKATAYFAGTHVPLIISGPRIAKGKIVKDGVSLIDLMPTILDYAKINIPKNVQGISLMPILENKTGAKARKLVFTEHNAHGPGSFYPSRSVNDGRFHYILNLKPELKYHFPADLMSKNKIWGNYAYEATVKAKDEFPIQYELLQKTIKRPAEELYDLHTDPGEINNLANDPRFSNVLEKMRAEVKEWENKTGDKKFISKLH